MTRFTVAGLLLAACAGAGGDPERVADEHYREGRFRQAMAAYEDAARPAPRSAVWAKLGAAALAAEDGPTALAAYERLAETDPTRAAEAARGVERAARLLPRGDRMAATAAVAALRRMTPDRPLGRLAVSADPGASPEAGRDVLPAAVAGAASGSEVDEALLLAGDGLRRAGACDAAVRPYRTLLRRAADPSGRAAASAGIAHCALQLGGEALAADRAEEAERWFDAAVRADPSGEVGFQARVAWGDARLRQGDVLAAVLTWQMVRDTPGAPETVARLAAERLDDLAASAPPPGGEGTVP